MIREYKECDTNQINVLGRYLSLDYLFHMTPERKCFVFKKNKDIRGFITFDLLGDRSEIIDMIVHINHRKNGYGTELLNKAVEISRENGCNSVSLEVKTTNKEAIEFYKNNEFNIVSTRKNYYESGSIDAHLMHREL